MGYSELSIYISHSLKDSDWHNNLCVHLRPFERMGNFRVRDDKKLYFRQNLDLQINDILEACKIVIILVSPDYLYSNFLFECEFQRIFEQYQKGLIYIAPIIVRPSVWSNISPISQLPVFPKSGKPLSMLTESEAEWELASIATEIYLVSREFHWSEEIINTTNVVSSPIEKNIFYRAGEQSSSDEFDSEDLNKDAT